jgi:2-methylisocitrate lyase-like PEP mutase family enzyme
LKSQTEKAAIFRALHERDHAFIIPNPWDLGTAKMLEALGFEALATTSAGFAQSIGKADGAVDRDTMLAHAAQLAAATNLPVSADLENGYADEPAGVAETVRLAAAAGLAGCSIEDLPAGRAGEPYDLAFAAERIAAAAKAVRALPFAFTLTARAENYIADRPDLADTIARLQAYQEAGADVLYAPGLRSADDIAAVVRAVDRPVNVLMGLPGVTLTLADLSALGVRRVSIGSALSSLAYRTAQRAAKEMHDRGVFTELTRK